MSLKQKSRHRRRINDKEVSRLPPLDLLRGTIIVLMALDHASHFIARQHSPGEYWGGAFPVYHHTLAFLTRLVSHLCAPGFFFLMGVGMLYFANSRRKQGWSEWAVIRHFLIRGGVLIGLQLLVVNRAGELSPGGWGVNIYIGVLFALGGTMILGSLLLRLSSKHLLILTAVLVLATELLTPDPSRWNQGFHPLLLLLLAPGGDLSLWVNYPVLPWLELVTFGMAFGHWLVNEPQRAFKRALWFGAAFIPAFFVLRLLNGFGNIRPMEGNSWIDFLNLVKYPPSISFTLLTMGVNLIVLWLFARSGERLLRFFQPLLVFGRSPLFFYTAHLFLYAGLGHLFAPKGTDILRMYLCWLLDLLILFPLCLWYGHLKQRHPNYSILRFF